MDGNSKSNEFPALQEELALAETNWRKAYTSCKAVIGWPICGQAPKNLEPHIRTEAEAILNRWITFVKAETARMKQIETQLKIKYKRYPGEKPTPIRDIKSGQTPEKMLGSAGTRVLEA